MTPKTLFTPEELIAACQTAEEAGDDSLRSVFDIAPSARAAVNGSVHYLDLTARVPGKAGKLYVRFRNERLVGLILPLKGDPHESVRDPSRAPTLGIQKYKVGPDSEDPSRSALSPYFQVIAYLDRFFGAAVRRLLLDGDLHTKADAAEAPPGSLLIKSDSPIRLLQDAVSSASKTNPASGSSEGGGLPMRSIEVPGACGVRGERPPDPGGLGDQRGRLLECVLRIQHGDQHPGVG